MMEKDRKKDRAQQGEPIQPLETDQIATPPEGWDLSEAHKVYDQMISQENPNVQLEVQVGQTEALKGQKIAMPGGDLSERDNASVTLHNIVPVLGEPVLTKTQQTDKHAQNAPKTPSEEGDISQHFSRGSIGAILLDSGKMSAEQAEQVLHLQKAEGLRFGEAAVKLGLVTEEDIQFALSQQFDYPYLDAGAHEISQELIAAYQPFSAQVEALRGIRTQLMLRLFTGTTPNSLAVVSPAPGDGRSYLAANLAIVFSQLGEKTLLIDADMRKPRQHILFGLDNQSGFSTYLSGRANQPTIRRIGAFVDLSVLTAGAVPPNPQELMYRPQFAQLLRKVTEEFSVVIIDTPAWVNHADAQLIASKTGTTLMVTRRHLSKVRDVSTLADAIRNVGGNIVGAVINEYK